MVTVYCALYPEAQELIGAFQLKKETAQKHFQVFSGKEAGIRVVITGAGAVAAAAAVAELSTCYPPEKQDILFNFGSCASGEGDAVGELFLCNKITEMSTGRTFYPDVLYRHPFAEAALVSAPKVMGPEEMRGLSGLCDMEAAAVYQAGNYSYSPHQMLFVKVVTDHGVAPQTADHAEKRADFQEQLRAAGKRLCPYLAELRTLCEEERETAAAHSALRQQASKDAKVLGEKLHCSVTMQAGLDQLLFYCLLTGKDYAGRVEEYARRGCLPAKDKREGKKLLEELRAELL
jgi:hypothetical protein